MDTSPQPQIWKTERREAIQNMALLLLVVAVIVVGSFFIKIEDLEGWVAQTGLWGPLVLVLLKASTIVFAPLSGSPLYPLAGALFGPWYGLLYIVLGDMLGAVISFYLSRRYGRALVMRFLSQGNIKFLDAALSYMGTLKGFLIARILFSPLPEIASYGAGLTKLPFLPFFVIHSVIGLVPAFILVWFGASLSLASGPWGLLAILLVGSFVAGLGILIFFKFVQPRALAVAEEETKREG